MSLKNIFRPFKGKYDFIKSKFKKYNIFETTRSPSNIQCEPILLQYNKKSFDETTRSSYYPTVRCGFYNKEIYIQSKSLLELKYERLINNIESIWQFNGKNVNGSFYSYIACPATSARFKRKLWAKPHQPAGRWTNPLLYLVSRKRHKDDMKTSKLSTQNVSPSLNKKLENTSQEDMFTLGNKHPSQLSAEQYLVYLYYKEYDRLNNTKPSSSKQTKEYGCF
ncbi:uncharacterized protein LOC136083746 [Hydra vulgaris]|uniref:Uncharacterized protein LOC136083746 n=1 Tax=Hydra vulgaris TaxID=6087 RepID=A0ABM4CCR1_HYDVU